MSRYKVNQKKFFKSAGTILSLIFSLTILFSACNDQESQQLRVWSEDTLIIFESDKIQLRFDEQLFCKVSYIEGDKLLSINDETQEATSLPSHFIQSGGNTYTQFAYSSHDVENINDAELGKGMKLVLNGELDGIRKTLSVEIYEKFPDIAISECTYTNL